MKKKTEPSLRELADAAFIKATEQAIKVAIDTNTPLILWKDGKIAKVDPRTVKIGGKRASRTSGKHKRRQSKAN